MLEDGCYKQNQPCLSVIDPVVSAFSRFLGAESIAKPGGQHSLDTDYFSRISAESTF